jgi:flavin-dependent dehydrogenase
VVQLHRWGLLAEVLDSGVPAIRQVSFHGAGESVRRRIKDKAGVDLLVAPRRYVLDTIFASAAQHAGAQLRLGVTVTGVQRDGRGRVVGVLGQDRGGAGVELAGRWVVGADGLGSRVAELVGATITQAGPAGGAVQHAYYAGIGWAGIEFFVAARSFAGVFPTHDGQACIWVCTPAADARAVRRGAGSRVEAFDQLLEGSAPELALRLGQARRTSPIQGMLRQPNQLRQGFGPGWALVGDAGYYRDAVTAYGISDAFHHAELLAAALDQALGGVAEEATAWPAISTSATRRSGRSSRSPAGCRPTRRCRGSSSCKSS